MYLLEGGYKDFFTHYSVCLDFFFVSFLKDLII